MLVAHAKNTCNENVDGNKLMQQKRERAVHKEFLASENHTFTELILLSSEMIVIKKELLFLSK